MRDDIFVQIAAYCDPELLPTLRDAITHAARPDRLHFCIAWQHRDELAGPDPFAEFRAHARFTILDIPADESKGACWARHQIQQHYDGEAYTLQLDSHHRFVPGWDDVCVTMLRELQDAGVPKPLLTAYLPSYDPRNDPAAREPDPWLLAFDRFTPEGITFFLPVSIPPEARTRAYRSRFYSAHFAFTIGEFAREVQHDPTYYFHGEEISIALRAFTHGYDLFHPHRLVAWHEYTRRGRDKHWDHHPDWWKQNVKTHERLRRLFGMDEYRDRPDEVRAEREAPFGLGTVRTFEDYERYTGLCFRRRAVTANVFDLVEPSPDDNQGISYEEFAARGIARFRHCIDIGYSQVPLDDYELWVVSFTDADGKVMYRDDADPEEIAHMKADEDKYCKVWREFPTEEVPSGWIVWPYSTSQGWCAPIVGTLR